MASFTGPFPTWTRGNYWGRFHDQNSGNKGGEGQGTGKRSIYVDNPITIA